MPSAASSRPDELSNATPEIRNDESKLRRRQHELRSAKVVRSNPPRRIEIPPVWANSNEAVDAELIASDPGRTLR